MVNKLLGNIESEHHYHQTREKLLYIATQVYYDIVTVNANSYTIITAHREK